VRQREVHVRGSNRGRERFVSVCDGDYDIGLEIVENSRQLENSQAGRLGHGGRAFALEDHEDALGDLETILFDHPDRIAVAVEKCRCRNDKLEGWLTPSQVLGQAEPPLPLTGQKGRLRNCRLIERKSP